MALYDYRCEEHGLFEARNGVDARGSAPCPECGTTCKQVIIGSPMIDPRLGVSRDFPSMARKWERKRRLLTTGRMKDPNATAYGTSVDHEKEAHINRKAYEQ